MARFDLEPGDADDREYETDFPGFGRTFPHPFGAGDDKYFTTRLTLSPAGDELTLDFTKALLDNAARPSGAIVFGAKLIASPGYVDGVAPDPLPRPPYFLGVMAQIYADMTAEGK